MTEIRDLMSTVASTLGFKMDQVKVVYMTRHGIEVVTYRDDDKQLTQSAFFSVEGGRSTTA